MSKPFISKQMQATLQTEGAHRQDGDLALLSSFVVKTCVRLWIKIEGCCRKASKRTRGLILSSGNPSLVGGIRFVRTRSELKSMVALNSNVLVSWVGFSSLRQYLSRPSDWNEVGIKTEGHRSVNSQQISLWRKILCPKLLETWICHKDLPSIPLISGQNVSYCKVWIRGAISHSYFWAFILLLYALREKAKWQSVRLIVGLQVDCHKHLSFCWMASASPLWELTSFSQCQHHSILFELPIDDHLWELVRGKIQLDDAHSNVESLRFLKISDDEVSQSQYDGSHRVAVTPSWAFPDNSLPKRFYKKNLFLCQRS